jgi:hypothetical protein
MITFMRQLKCNMRHSASDLMRLIMAMGVAAVVGDFYASCKRDGCFEYIKRARKRERKKRKRGMDGCTAKQKTEERAAVAAETRHQSAYQLAVLHAGRQN